jgi:hypothetical protein
MTYTLVIAEQMLEKIKRRGWNAYKKGEMPSEESPEANKERFLGFIREGPAEILEVDSSYVLLPKASDPADPECVQKTLDMLLNSRRGAMPTVTIIYDSHPRTWPITGITLKEHEVKFHTPEGTYVNYEKALESLDTLIGTGLN